ncbi:MAG TPA: N-acetylmuramoyl-L-alanine amidase [Verrucomicrobiales bacterium]|nr:N-acetylmuramoyl-L-alanine amidase [Verrucomicrobiales bacterium]
MLPRFGPVLLLLSASMGFALAQLGPLAPAPEWKELDAYQEAITRQEFLDLLDNLYAPGGAARGLIDVQKEHATIRMGTSSQTGVYHLRFAANRASAKPARRYWRPAAAIGGRTTELPLRGMHIALDPGHIGGTYARMEERWFQWGDAQPVTEGDMTLIVARLLKPKLEALGARVSLVRESDRPVTRARPKHFRSAALAELRALGITRPRPTYDPGDPPSARRHTLQWQEEQLFYRTAEIRARADLVNRKIRPDLVVCLHFNAESWGDPRRPDMIERNHLHVLVNGAYSRSEVLLDDNRFDLLLRLLQGASHEEVPAAGAVATAMARRTGLPAYVYSTSNARRTGRNPYVYARNLLANRLYQCPVLFLEPYVMNSPEVHERVQAGDYRGAREVGGKLRLSLYEEYALSVAEGLASHYRASR